MYIMDFLCLLNWHYCHCFNSFINSYVYFAFNCSEIYVVLIVITTTQLEYENLIQIDKERHS